MAWTDPRTWTDAETITASIMNTHVRDNMRAVRRVLGYAYLASGADAIAGPASGASYNDIDAALSVTFTVPQSGVVLVSLNAALSGGSLASSPMYWAIRDGGSTIASTAVSAEDATGAASASSVARRTVDIVITGLTPGASKTYTWGFRGTSGNIRKGANWPLTMIVWQLP